MTPISYKRRRFAPDIIQHTFWLCTRFTLSYRDVEAVLAEGSIDVSNETLRRWFLKFGGPTAANLRRARPRSSDHRHLDEMGVIIRGERYWLWRAGDNEGEVLDLLVQRTRSARVAKKLMTKPFKKQGFAPTRIVTDKLRSYPAAFRALSLTAVHDRGSRANNRAEYSHQPVRRRERKRQRFKSRGSAQHFLYVHTATQNISYYQRHLLRRPTFKSLRGASFKTWADRSTAN
jgi:transposase-like protein